MNIAENFITTGNNASAEKEPRPKRTDSDKLEAYYAKRKKLHDQKNEIRQKSKELDNNISRNDANIAALENKALECICRKKKITTKQLIEFLTNMPEGMTLENTVFSSSGAPSENGNS